MSLNVIPEAETPPQERARRFLEAMAKAADECWPEYEAIRVTTEPVFKRPGWHDVTLCLKVRVVDTPGGEG